MFLLMSVLGEDIRNWSRQYDLKKDCDFLCNFLGFRILIEHDSSHSLYVGYFPKVSPLLLQDMSHYNQGSFTLRSLTKMDD